MRSNLLTEPWLPVRREDGSEGRVAPWQIGVADPPVVDIVPSRPDFRAALYEFLVGLLQTAMPPEDTREWRDKLASPPAPEVLREAFRPYEPYFELFGDGVRFLQDVELDAGKPKDRSRVEALLMDAPGNNTLKNNGDFFIKRGRVERLCPDCAAMALYTMQAFAPSGGKGNRTSLRGGGPLSTLVQGKSLWETVWGNVLPLNAKVDPQPEPAPVGAKLPGAVFPWAAPTRTSEKGQTVHPGDVHYLHAYWAMPRRYRLVEEETAAQACSLCQQETTLGVREVVQRPYGYNYGDSWQHPLTPYRVQGADKPPLSIKGQAGITGYAHWLGVVYGQPGGSNKFPMRPAHCVESSVRLKSDFARQVMVNGYDMDNMKARQFCSGSFPVMQVDAAREEAFLEVADQLVRGADQVRRNLAIALKEALVHASIQKNIKLDATRLADVAAAFWGRTESGFYEACGELAAVPSYEESEPLRREWMDVLTRAATSLFDEQVSCMRVDPTRIERQVEARKKMRNFNYRVLQKVLEIDDQRGAA